MLDQWFTKRFYGPPASFIVDDIEWPLRAVSASNYVVWYCDLRYTGVRILCTVGEPRMEQEYMAMA